MSKKEIERKEAAKWWTRLDGRVKNVLIVSFLALVLIFAAWQIFHTDATDEAVSVAATDTEAKVIRLLQEIDGVGEADVIVYEAENTVKSVVVVCEGANNLRVVMNVREAVASALGAEEKAVKIYLKKE
ncbi:MAG: hypothetical protein IJ284_04080 [Clostridia bacterium]|nr:hypothetical protein [Clostridia bacterium]